MGVQYIGDGGPDGTIVGRASHKLAFFGVTTVTGKQAVVTTVDSTTITAVQVATATTTNLITAVNLLITDSRAQAKALNQLITKLRSLGLFASS